MIVTYEEMIASVDQMLHDACDNENIDYNEFVLALGEALDARYEIVEA